MLKLTLLIRNILWVLSLEVIYVGSVVYPKEITDVIFQNYDSDLTPMCNGNSQINLTMGIAVRQVIDLNEPNQIAKLNLWIRLKWNDCLLTWNPNDYDGTDNIIVPIKKIWIPDLTLYASVTTEFGGIKNYKAVVYSDGTVYYNFPTIVETLCPIDVQYFPFDTQLCTLKFGSWAYHGLLLDIQPRDDFGGDLSQIKGHVEWQVLKVPVYRNVVYYGCCVEPYPDVTFVVYLKRKPNYYVINIIVPSIMITVLAILGYFLPVDSGEKVSLVITVMLSMSVFQLLVADKLPPSADSTPLLMFFFNFILGISAMSTALQVFVINTYYRGDKEVSVWLKRYIIKPACFLTFVDIPGEPQMCPNKNQVEQFIEDKEEKGAANDVIWQCFSVAIDRLGILMFSLTLVVGSVSIFSEFHH